MIGKISTFTLITVITSTTSFAQPIDKQQREKQAPNTGGNYGANLITVSPFIAMDYGVGVGLSYERLFGAYKKIGVILPVSLMLDGSNSPGYRYATSDLDASIYFTPGLKIYPFGQQRLTYAVGPSLMVNYGKRSSVPASGFPVEGAKVSWLRLGIMVANYLNFQVTRSFNLGLEMGLGLRYLDRQIYTEPNRDVPLKLQGDMKPTGRFALSLGFRF